MSTVKAWAALAKGEPLQRFDYEVGPLGDEEVEIRVEHCGICHSDLAMIDSEWFPAGYPVVPGHEVVGIVTAVGPHAKGRSVGQRVGIGWHTGSCSHCNRGGSRNTPFFFEHFYQLSSLQNGKLTQLISHFFKISSH